MKDLDFDELDKAVSSMVGGAKPAPKLRENQPVTGGSATPVIPPKSQQSAGNITVTPGRRSARLGVARTGKSFSDIIPIKPPAKLPSRSARTVTPTPSGTNSESKPEAVSPTAPSIEPPVTPSATLSASPVASKPAAKAPSPAAKTTPKAHNSQEKWPDPLDFHAELEKPSAPTVDKKTGVDGELLDNPSDQPSSPFLPGAKIDKRPLGAFTDTPEAPAKVPTPSAPVLAEESPELPKAPSQEDPQEAIAVATEQEAEALAETTQEEADQVHKQVLESAQASIAPQYKTPEKAPSQDKRPVFDTKEYHPPLIEATVHGHKSSGGASKFVLGLLIVALLAAGGYFVYLYFMQGW